MKDHVEIDFYYHMEILDDLIEALQANQIPFVASERTVLHYSAEYSTHIATSIMLASKGLLVSSICSLLKRYLSYGIQKRELRRIKIKVAGNEIMVGDETQLDEAVAAASKLMKAATRSGAVKRPAQRKPRSKKKPDSPSGEGQD